MCRFLRWSGPDEDRLTCNDDAGLNLIIYLKDRRFQASDLAGEFQHVSGGVPLLTLALGKIAAGDREWPLAVVEALIAGVLLVIFIHDVRGFLLRKKQAPASASHARLSWFDVAAGVLLLFEAFHGHHSRPGYLRPQFLSGIVTLALGLFHSPFQAFRQRRRYLKLDANGLTCRPGLLRRFSIAWAKLESVEVTSKEAIFLEKKGRRRVISLRRYDNREAIASAIIDHARAAGLLPPAGENSNQNQAQAALG